MVEHVTRLRVGAQAVPGPARAWAALVAGHRRFADRALRTSASRHPAGRKLSRPGPRAVVFASSEDPITPERLFDAEPGELLVVRTVAHAVDAAVLGSLEYGLTVLGAPLLVVVGNEDAHVLPMGATPSVDAPPAGVPAFGSAVPASAGSGSAVPGVRASADLTHPDRVVGDLLARMRTLSQGVQTGQVGLVAVRHGPTGRHLDVLRSLGMHALH